jgi:hypothetical protein
LHDKKWCWKEEEEKTQAIDSTKPNKMSKLELKEQGSKSSKQNPRIGSVRNVDE